MFQEINATNIDPQTRKTTIEPLSRGHTILTLGARSYLVGGTAYYFSTDAHILVGKYSSLAHNMSFYLGQNHSHASLSTYPFGYVLNRAAGNEHDVCNRHQIIIGSDVWIGGDVTIMSGVRIGSGAVIGAGAVIAKDVPPYAVVVGNPARVIKYRFDAETIARLLRIKWWNWRQEDIERYIPQYKDDLPAFLERFDPVVQEEPSDAAAAAIRELRAQGFAASYLVPDFDAPANPVWPRVIDSFLAAYTAEDKTALVLAIPDNAVARACTTEITEHIAEAGESAPLIVTHDVEGDLPYSRAALQASSAYITTREAICSAAVEDAAEAGLAIRYGLDVGEMLFPRL